MPRFMYTIISFVFFSGIAVYYIVAFKEPENVTIYLLSILIFILFGFLSSICLYFIGIKTKQVTFPFNPKKVYRKLLGRSFLLSFVLSLLLLLQLFKLLDLLTLLLLLIFFGTTWVVLAPKKDTLELA